MITNNEVETARTIGAAMDEMTLIQILHGDEPKGLTKEVAEALKEVANDPKKALKSDFLLKKDALTKAVYRHTEDGKIVLPLTPEAAALGIQPRLATVGEQCSTGNHDEDVKDHSLCAVSRLHTHMCCYTRKQGEEAKEERRKKVSRPAVAFGLWHDAGKKYTACTNAKGEISNFAHAKVSAYLAKHWLDKLGLFDNETRTVIVTAIYMHDMVKDDRPYYVEQLKETQQALKSNEPFCGNGKINERIAYYCDTMAQADVGILKDPDGSYCFKYDTMELYQNKETGVWEKVAMLHYERNISDEKRQKVIADGEAWVQAAFDDLLS